MVINHLSPNANPRWMSFYEGEFIIIFAVSKKIYYRRYSRDSRRYSQMMPSNFDPKDLCLSKLLLFFFI